MVTSPSITPSIGAEISGLDSSRPISPEIHDEIYQALLDHLVIFFRGAEISPDAHLGLPTAEPERRLCAERTLSMTAYGTK